MQKIKFENFKSYSAWCVVLVLVQLVCILPGTYKLPKGCSNSHVMFTENKQTHFLSRMPYLVASTGVHRDRYYLRMVGFSECLISDSTGLTSHVTDQLLYFPLGLQARYGIVATRGAYCTWCVVLVLVQLVYMYTLPGMYVSCRRRIQIPMLCVLMSKCKVRCQVQIIDFQVWKLLSRLYSPVTSQKRVGFYR